MAKRMQPFSLDSSALPKAGLPNECFRVLMKANAQAGQMWLDTWTRMAGEMASFAVKRWTSDAALYCRCYACKTPMDLMNLQAEFVQRMFGDYMREAARLADMETDAATAGIGEIDHGVRRATDLVESVSPTSGSRARSATRH